MDCPKTNETRPVPVPAIDSSIEELILQTFKQLGLLSPRPLQNGKLPIKQAGYKQCITTTFQSATWQYTDPAINNPVKAVNGPAGYDARGCLLVTTCCNLIKRSDPYFSCKRTLC